MLRVETEGATPDQRRTAYIGIGVRLYDSHSLSNVPRALILLLRYRIGPGRCAKLTSRHKAATAQKQEDSDEDAPPRPSPHLPAGPRKDFTLREGEMLHLQTPSSQPKAALAPGSQLRKGFVLPPPPSAKRG